MRYTLATLLLAASSAHAFFRLPCARPVLDSRVDPIVNPGVASGHAHTIMGANNIGISSTFEDMRASTCSTCAIKDDSSAYWIPQLYYQFQNGSFISVDHGGMLVYYLQRGGSNETIQAFPDKLRMLAGNPNLRSATGTVEASAISFNCINYDHPSPETLYMANTDCPQGLRAQVFFPGCWDGVNVDSADHKSHMAYPSGMNAGTCPPTHPVHLISIFYEVYFSVDPINKLNLGGRFVFSQGDPTGYGLHGDFMNGWDRSVLSRAVTECTNDSGVIQDCHVFDGRYYTDAENAKCNAPNPFESADGSMKNLPGCITIQNGPAAATAADSTCPNTGGAALASTSSAVSSTTSSTASVPTSTKSVASSVTTTLTSSVVPPTSSVVSASVSTPPTVSSVVVSAASSSISGTSAVVSAASSAISTAASVVSTASPIISTTASVTLASSSVLSAVTSAVSAASSAVGSSVGSAASSVALVATSAITTGSVASSTASVASSVVSTSSSATGFVTSVKGSTSTHALNSSSSPATSAASSTVVAEPTATATLHISTLGALVSTSATASSATPSSSAVSLNPPHSCKPHNGSHSHNPHHHGSYRGRRSANNRRRGV